MTTRIQNHTSCTGGDHRDWPRYALEVEVELERLDRDAGHDYIPMDIFVDPRTMREHFQVSSIRSRWARIHAGSNDHEK